MRELLFLAHRIPYPPNKGDKIRSWHILKHLATRVPVHLGCFLDDPEDARYVADLERVCASVHVVPLNRRLALAGSLAGLLTGEALSMRFYRHRAMTDWVARTLRERPVDAAFAFSSQMFPYLMGTPTAGRLVFDFVDVDSAKWAEYGRGGSGPKAWIYRREGRLLADFERKAAAAADASLFVSEAEAALFRARDPRSAAKVHAVSNGVDLDVFRPGPGLPSPHPEGGPVIAFVGAMDYWPNVEGVCWFAKRMWPAIRSRHPGARFCIVGSNPSPEVTGLAAVPGVTVTGRVPDVRGYVEHADVVVAPLRIARGIQNKVLEAMAMGKPVVAHPAAFEGIDAQPGSDLLLAETEAGFVEAVDTLLGDPQRRAAMGAGARRRMEARYAWDRCLGGLDALLDLTPERRLARELGRTA